MQPLVLRHEKHLNEGKEKLVHVENTKESVKVSGVGAARVERVRMINQSESKPTDPRASHRSAAPQVV